MKWPEHIATAFPRRRDDEPPDLRSRIVKELRDHLECAYQGELLKTADKDEAERRVLRRFGDPKRMARKLWLDAMQEKIMSQRILMFWSGLMAAACVAMGGFVYRIVEQSAEANRALVKDMREANRSLLEQARAFNLALIERLDRRTLDGAAPQTEPQPRQPAPAATEEQAETAKVSDWVRLRLRLVKDKAGGEPAAGYTMDLRNWSGDPHATVIQLSGKSDAEGQFDAGLLAPGQYDVALQTPWEEATSRTIQLRPGNAVETIEMVCPGSAPAEFNVSLDVEWPDDMRKRNVGLLVRCEDFPRELAGQTWNVPQTDGAFADEFVVTLRGIVLQSTAGWTPQVARRVRPYQPVQEWDGRVQPEPSVPNLGFSPSDWGSVAPLPNDSFEKAYEEDQREICQIVMQAARARPESTLHWRGIRYAFHVKGVVIIEALEAYPNQHLLVFGPNGDPAQIESEFQPDQPNPRVAIPISPALAANVRRVLDAPTPRESQFIPGWNVFRSDDPNEFPPNPAQKLVAAAEHFELRGDRDRALDSISKAIKAHPKYAGNYLLRCLLEIRMHQPEKASQDFAEALRLDQKHAGLFYEYRAALWDSSGELDKAIADYTDALKLKLDAHDACNLYRGRARVWKQRRELRKALADYTEGIRIASQSRREFGDPSYEERAAILTELGEIDKAIADYSEIIQQYEGDVDARIARANLWWQKGDLDKTLQDYTEAVRHGAQSESACNGLAWFLATVDDRRYRNGKRAIEHASKACELSGWNNSDYFDTLAAGHAKAGNFELAAQWVAKVLEMMKGTTQKANAVDLKAIEERLELYRSGKPYREHVNSRTAKRDVAP